MTDKQRQSRSRQAEDAAFHRMLLWLLGAVVAEVVILLVKHFYVDVTGAAASVAIAGVLAGFFRVYRFLGAALTAAGLVWAVVWARQGRRRVLPAILTGVVGLLWLVSCVAYYFFDDGLRILMMLPAAAGVLILVYFLYQRVFFINAALTGGGMAVLWLYRIYYTDHPRAVIACFIAGWVLLAAAAVLCWVLRQGGGKLGEMRLMPAKAGYGIIWVTCVLVAAAMALGLVFGATVSLYLIFGLIGWLFCQAVFFTVRLM